MKNEKLRDIQLERVETILLQAFRSSKKTKQVSDITYKNAAKRDNAGAVCNSGMGIFLGAKAPLGLVHVEKKRGMEKFQKSISLIDLLE